MAIDAKMIKALRDKTGMGITDCKNALNESDGNMEEAEMLLRKRQKEKAIKKADRPTGEGVVALRVADDGSYAVMVEVACEQEPTKNNERFAAFVEKTLDVALAAKPADAAALLATQSGGATMQDELTELAGTVGENVQLRRAVTLEAGANGIVGHYAHFNQKAAAICVLTLDGADAANEALKTMANDVCMHAVAARPAALDPESLSPELVAREKEVFLDEVKDKPENIQEKILEGKLQKFYADKCLVKQIFVKDPDGKKSVTQAVEEAAKAAGGKAAVTAFSRFELGLDT